MHIVKASGRLFLSGLFLAGLTACAGLAPGSPQHGLAGKFWDVGRQRFVPDDVVVRQALAVDIVLLGETHDNLDHHALQLSVLRAAADAGPVSALVMEQYDLEQQADIDAILRAQRTDADKLEELRRLMGAGWPWPGYRPLIAFALERRIPIVAANISRDALRQVSRTGFAALGAREAARLGLSTDWPAARQAQLERDIDAGHCGMLPPAAIAGISRAQRVRDAVMADKLLKAEPGRVIGILGRGHVRKDLGVPLYLAARAPDRKSMTVGLLEAGAADGAPAGHARGSLGDLYDYVAFTEARERGVDPCTSLTRPAEKER